MDYKRIIPGIEIPALLQVIEAHHSTISETVVEMLDIREGAVFYSAMWICDPLQQSKFSSLYS